MAKKTKKREIRRSAITGRFITKSEAERNPSTTVTETIPKSPKKRTPKSKKK